MKKFLFVFHNAWKHIIYYKCNSIVLLIALMLGFIFPLLAVNDVNDLLRDGYVSKYADSTRVAIIEYSMKYKDKKDIYDAISYGKNEKWFDNAGFCMCHGEFIYVGEESYSGGVSGVSEEYLALSRSEILEGEFFSGDDYKGIGEKVCLLEYQSILVRNGIRVGDTIEILGEIYRVKGIVRAPRIYGGVLIPYVMCSELFCGMNGLIQYQIVTYGEVEPNPVSIAHRLFQGEEVITANTGMRQEEIYYKSIGEVNKYRLLRAAIVICIADINIILLFMGMVVREQYSMAVHLIAGASCKIMRFEIIVRNLLLMIIAFLMAIFVYPYISVFVKGANCYLQDITILQVGGGGAFLVIFTNCIMFEICLKKREVNFLLKK